MTCFWSSIGFAQEDAIRFFDLEPKPSISLLNDQTFNTKRSSLKISGNIYATQRRSIDMGKQIELNENRKNYLMGLYEARIQQQQQRLSNTNTSVRTNSDKNRESNVQLRSEYQHQPYGWQDDFYRSSILWQPDFYQQTSFGRLRANRRMF